MSKLWVCLSPCIPALQTKNIFRRSLCENCKYKRFDIKQTFLVTLDIFNRHNENNGSEIFNTILHVSISQHFIALGFLIQTRATKWLNCFEAESFCFTPTLIRDEISISSYLKCKPFVINIFWLAKFITHKKFQYLEQSLNRNNEEEACGRTEICGNFNENEILMIPIIYKV